MGLVQKYRFITTKPLNSSKKYQTNYSFVLYKEAVNVVSKIQEIFAFAKNTTTFAILISTCLMVCTNVNAEERQGLLLNAAVKAQHDSNVLRTNDAVSDTSLHVSPELTYLTHMGKHIFALNYEGEYTAYKDNTSLNYDDHDISLLARLDHSLKVNTDFKLAYKNKIEVPGINNSITSVLDEFNQTNIKQASAKIYYGTNKSIGQWIVELEHLENRFTNNVQDYRDVDRNKLTGTFFYRVAPKTRLFFQASIGDYDYKIKSRDPDQSSKETFYLAGLEWDLTEQTSGTFKLGYQGKNFEQDVYNDVTGLSYMLDMKWKPNTYTTIEIGASRMTRESSQLLTSAFITNTYSAKAEHEISARTAINATYTYDNDDLVTSQNRTDKRHQLVLGVDHSLLTWLNVSFGYQFIQRDSDFELYNYKANVVGLSLSTKFK